MERIILGSALAIFLWVTWGVVRAEQKRLTRVAHLSEGDKVWVRVKFLKKKHEAVYLNREGMGHIVELPSGLKVKTLTTHIYFEGDD